MYHVYYGPSGCGKSIALSNALENKTGIIHLSVRNCIGSSELWSNLGTACGFIDNNTQPISNQESFCIL